MADFLTFMYQEDKAYSTINTARSALSALGIKIDGTPVGAHPLITRLMRGIFNKRPTRAKYTSVWDVNQVLQHLKNTQDVKDISLKELTLKLTMLIALTQAARPQTIHLISLKNLKKTQDRYVLELDEALKHTRPGTPLEPIIIKAFPHDKNLCVFTTLEEYIERTREHRNNEDRLMISYVKPHKAVTRDSIRRWIRVTMENAGINTEIYGAYSTRAASASKAASLNIPICNIMKTAGWARETTFTKYYLKNVTTPESYSDNLLNNALT